LKLTEKKREGSRVRKKYDEARTPYERVLASDVVSEELNMGAAHHER
jgi:hypothetical protein